MSGRQEFSVIFPERKAGSYVWYVAAECEDEGRTRAFEGEVLLVVEPQGEARTVAGDLVVEINTNINAGHASDVRLNQSAADALSKIVKSSEDPFKALRKLVGVASARGRKWNLTMWSNRNSSKGLNGLRSCAATR